MNLIKKIREWLSKQEDIDPNDEVAAIVAMECIRRGKPVRATVDEKGNITYHDEVVE